MVGSKNEAKRNWMRGRTGYSFRHDMKFSLKMNKKMLNRKVRRLKAEVGNRCNYKRYAKDAAYSHMM